MSTARPRTAIYTKPKQDFVKPMLEWAKDPRLIDKFIKYFGR